MMTRDRARKAQARALHGATGMPYVVARRAAQQPSPLAEVMTAHPELNDFGIGVFDAHRKPRHQREEELAQQRRELAARERDVLEVAHWLQANITPIATPGVGSYGLKHLVERRIGRYVTNGEAIAAALIVGYPHRYGRTTGPNVLFGMSQRDYNRLRA